VNRGSADETFARVVDSLDTWTPEQAATTAARQVYTRLQADLNGGVASRWERSVIELNSGTLVGDVTVDGVIGIVVFDADDTAHLQSVARRLGVLSEHFNYLVIYWWWTDPSGADRRRTVERYYAASTLGLNGLVYVSRARTDEPATGTETTDALGRRTVGLLIAVGLTATVTIGLLSTVARPLITDLAALPDLIQMFLLLTGGLFLGALGLGVSAIR
jgi:hypothetical protein